MEVEKKSHTHLDPTMTKHEPETGTYLDDPPDIMRENLSSNEKKEVVAYAHSNYSTETDVTVVAPSNFNPSRTLVINARGIALIRLPFPSRELEIIVSTPEGDLAYVSTRAKARSGNATLTEANGTALIASEYFWGPGRDPKLHILNRDSPSDIKIESKWTSRSQDFVLPSEQKLQWRYSREIDPSTSNTKGQKRSFLVLEVPGNKKEKNARLAQLIRNDETRTPGTKKCDAGNGGEIVMDENAMKSFGVAEDFVVASCLMMLKKEIDRRRTYQMLMVGGASSGGGS
ncbi:hypothetical protein EJ08DRAFT_648280 [Tothia fuscella]|uniref:Uncharacterized protein n=1 Tax=Tothia fuscella TaxID=1048955 RepID=A0A9P4NW17_9PEZI|nr:hypothetical protein EJ08DRAFT_648280 [Tothia fuscella]